MPKSLILSAAALVGLVFLSPGSSGAAPGARQKLRFKLAVGEVFIIEKYQDIQIAYRRRQRLSRRVSREEKNRIVLKVIKREGSAAVLQGTFTTYSRSPRKVGHYRLERKYFSRFKIHDDGRYEVPDKYIMPNLRDLPTFPKAPLSPSDRWKKPALETIHFRRVKIKMPVMVSYRYTGLQPLIKEAGKVQGTFPRLEYSYSINKRVKNPRSLIRHVTGFATDQLWFDSAQGIPVFDSNRLAYTFHMFDGSRVNYRFRILSWYRKRKRIKAPEKTKIVTQTRKQLAKQKSITVKKSKEGIVLTLNSVLFGFDSARLSSAALENLKGIAEILKKHPDREIRISGHTDNRGSSRYNHRLSTRRARAVLKALNRMGLKSKRMSYKGYGETKPVAPNDTPAGRRKNRRVEILIVTE